MFPLSMVLFPHAELPLHVFEERYRLMMRECLAGDAEFGVVLIARGSEVGGGDQRFDTGTLARITHVGALEDGRLLVLATGTRRLRVVAWLDDSPYPRARVEALPDGADEAEEADGADSAQPDQRVEARGPEPGAAATVSAESSVRRLRSLLSELGEVPAIPHDLVMGDDIEERSWQLCELAPLTPIDRQKLLDESRLTVRMALLDELCSALANDVLGMLAGGSGGLSPE